MQEIVQFTTLPLKAIRDEENESHIHLVMCDKGEGRRPIELGTGRNAVVFLGSSTEKLQSFSQMYYAIKFLKNDPDQEYARVAEERFFTEAANTRSFGQLAGSFVKYSCWGALRGKPPADDQPSEEQQQWDRWVKHLGESIYTSVNVGDLYKSALIDAYYLQGPFYALELCQATLYDLLDRNTPWLQLPVYAMQPPRAKELPSYRDAFTKTAQNMSRAISRVASHYIEGDIRHKSGYDILNAFKREPEANQVRNYAVLELFERIVSVVRDLHSHPRKLSHRDLKPGNIFLAHDANFDGIGMISLKLGDLGFTADRHQLINTSFSLNNGIQNPAALAPGSQFYRAPEQADLPIEVRVSFKPDTPSLVSVYSSKISNIQVGDRLVIGDPFKKGAQKRSTDQTDHNAVQMVFKINEVLKDERSNIVGFSLDGDLTIDKTEDIWAHVVRATGYHTDGYSLGAILYDLASGGRNPESFYTYCLVRFIEEFSHIKYSIDEIIEALAPAASMLGDLSDAANGRPAAVGRLASVPLARRAPPERWGLPRRPAQQRRAGAAVGQQMPLGERIALAAQLVKTADIEQVIDLILTSPIDARLAQAAAHANQQSSELLSLPDKWEIVKLLMGADSVDELISLILQSPIDVKMEALRAAGGAADPSALSIGEKWELLRLVMEADDPHGVLALIFSPSLDRMIAHEQTPSAGRATSLRKRWEYLKIVMQSDDLETLVEQILRSALSHNYQETEKHKVNERLRDYRFRNFHIVNDLLTDKRGVPIPADIIRIIVKCMLRNIDGGAETSYYASPRGIGFMAEENIRAIDLLYRDTLDRLADVQNQPPPGFPDELKQDLLFKLRSMADPLAQPFPVGEVVVPSGQQSLVGQLGDDHRDSTALDGPEAERETRAPRA